ncbi:MAG TPA: glycine betaine ABC transporter substrate-binding protein [Candidatus Limnocylindrales bacterium]
MRMTRMAALGATSLVLLVSACASGGSSSTPAATSAGASTPASVAPASEPASEPASAGPSIASQLVLGGPPECPTRPFCQQGLEKTYGITFKEFKPLDVAGPLTVEALKNGDVQVGMLLTSDPAYATNGFVLLQDDKKLQLADNLVPVLSKAIVDANPDVATLLNSATAKVTQSELTALNKAVTVDGQTSAEAATQWLTDNELLPATAVPSRGQDITVGSANFYEQEVLAEVFAQVLEANGFTVERKFQLGAREVVFPALEKGDIDLLVEYAATALEYVNKSAGEATTDATANVAKLNEHLAALGLVALEPASATDQNGFAVTTDTATQYSLTNLSDLANPAP